MTAALLLAHQGGWDEMLFVAIPIGVFAGLLWMANKRASATLEERDAQAEAQATPDAGTTETASTEPEATPPDLGQS